MSHQVCCKDCGAPIDEPSNTPADQRAPCPSCGSTTRLIKKELTATLDIHPSLGFKAKEQGKGRPFIEGKSGEDLYRKTGKWMFLERVIDRAKNWYKELITDPATGKIIHHCEEPLSEHRRHGSAKKKDKPKGREI